MGDLTQYHCLRRNFLQSGLRNKIRQHYEELNGRVMDLGLGSGFDTAQTQHQPSRIALNLVASHEGSSHHERGVR